MPDTTGAPFDWAGFLEREWAREASRKASLEQRAITVVTASGAFVTLVFGFVAAVTKGHYFGNFENWERVLLAFSVLFLALSAIYGMIANQPRRTVLLGLDDFMPVSIQQEMDLEKLKLMRTALKGAREANAERATALSNAIWLQIAGVVVLGAVIVKVVW